MKEYTLNHADTCLPSYWAGHNLPHVCFPPSKNMTLGEIKQALRNEINQDAIMGHDFLKDDDFYIAVEKAIENLKPNNPETKEFFTELEETEGDSCEFVMAYFVFVPV